jgi:metal-responsive CopG/Arc/MetJ family transcriptional regulator
VGRRTQTLVQLTDELVAELDAHAGRRGVSRSELIRNLLDAGLSKARGDDLARAMIDGYEKAPQHEGRDAWGDLSEWSETNRRRNLAALKAEEEGS